MGSNCLINGEYGTDFEIGRFVQLYDATVVCITTSDDKTVQLESQLPQNLHQIIHCIFVFLAKQLQVIGKWWKTVVKIDKSICENENVEKLENKNDNIFGLNLKNFSLKTENNINTKIATVAVPLKSELHCNQTKNNDVITCDQLVTPSIRVFDDWKPESCANTHKEMNASDSMDSENSAEDESFSETDEPYAD